MRFLTVALLALAASPAGCRICDPGLAPNCGDREEGGQVVGMPGCTWHFVTSFPASIDLCTGYASDCGEGPCNALETWYYTWEVWEILQGEQVVRRQGCIRNVITRVGSGRCCSGEETKERIRPMGVRGGGCQGCEPREPEGRCMRCHDE